MKLTRGKRIALELLGPPAIGVGGPFLVAASWSLVQAAIRGNFWHELGRWGETGLVVLAFAYFFAGAQSIAYTAVMEWRFARGLNPCSWRSVWWSTLLGFASGAAICLADGFDRADTLFLWLYLGGIGLAVGFVLGVLIKQWSIKPASGV